MRVLVNDGRSFWPAASTRLVALLGDPVRHSLSPLMHNAAFREADLDIVYVAFHVAPADVATIVAALRAVGAVGANVTVPHKEAVLALCDALTEEARLVGAVNTMSWTADGLLGDNTDAGGLEQVLRDDLSVAPPARVVVLGTGGAARAASVAVGRSGCEVHFVGRRPAAARRLADLAARCGSPRTAGHDLADGGVAEVVSRATVVVNATPLGLAGEPLPAPFMELHLGQVALDLIYNPPETPFLAAARSAGAEAHHGLGMLVAQAAASFRRWTGQEAPVAAMSAAALAGLRLA